MEKNIQSEIIKMPKKTSDVRIRKMRMKDLEIVMAWRSNPDLYIFFEVQKKPLTWDEHYNFWFNRKNREDYIIEYNDNGHWRKVGNLNLSLLNREYPELGILVGEVTLHGKGVGSKAVALGLKRLKKLGHTKSAASIHQDNKRSQKLFEKFGFKKVEESAKSLWKKYLLESIAV